MWFCKGRAEYIGKKRPTSAVEDFAKSIQVAPERFGGFHFKNWHRLSRPRRSGQRDGAVRRGREQRYVRMDLPAPQ